MPDFTIAGGPSLFFDAVVIAASEAGVAALLKEAAAIDWIRDAFGHLKAIGHLPATAPLFKKANVDMSADDGMVSLASGNGVKDFIAAAKRHRLWEREPNVRPPV